MLNMYSHNKMVLIPFIVIVLLLAGFGPALSAEAGKVSLNSASAEELAKVKGITPELAKAIAQYRTEHGPFKKTEDLLNVPGMNKTILDSIAPKLDQSGDILCPTGDNNEQEEEPSLAPSKC